MKWRWEGPVLALVVSTRKLLGILMGVFDFSSQGSRENSKVL